MEILLLGLWEEEGDETRGRCAGSMWILALLALAGVQGDVKMCVYGRGSTVRWRCKFRVEEILGLTVKLSCRKNHNLGLSGCEAVRKPGQGL